MLRRRPCLQALLPCAVLAAIDRRAVVSRHDVVVAASGAATLDTANDVFSVGNGAFAFNADVTGLQTFNASYVHLGVNTLADWGWHTSPFSAGDATAALRQYNFTAYETPISANASRRVPYANDAGNDPRVTTWLMENPHRLNLGQLSLRWQAGAGRTSAIPIEAVVASSQRLRLWEGSLDSNLTFSVGGGGPKCALVPDNDEAAFSCGGGPNGTITGVTFASYGQPTGSCAAGFAPSQTCASNTTAAVLAALCVGAPSCSLLVNYEAGFGDPCPGEAKKLAAAFECGPPATPAAGGNVSVRVATVAHPDVDAVAVSVACDAADGACPLALRLAFPYGSGAFGVSGADWNAPDVAHSTVMTPRGDGSGGVTFSRTLDGDAYRVDCSWPGGALTVTRAAPHAFDLAPPAGAPWPAIEIGVVCLFTPVGPSGGLQFPVGRGEAWMAVKAAATAQLLVSGPPPFATVAAAAAAGWAAYWGSGAFLDLGAGAADPAAVELERRVILSLYLTRVHSAGAEPPAETGLLCNSWNGKHHNEMRLWHQAHFATWGRPELLARSDGFFFDSLANATAWAMFQGYAGARWPKETAAVANPAVNSVPWLGLAHSPWPFGGAPNGSLLAWESTQIDNALILWQQPHVIWLAELQRRAAATAGGAAAALAVVARLQPLVSATADYLAARAYRNESDRGGRYWLGPPLMGGQEQSDGTRTFNPAYELVYTGVTLDIANEWRAYAGLPPSAVYDAVAGGLAAVPIDAASPADAPLYTLDLHCVCMYLRGGVANPGCDAAWVPRGGSTCDALASHPLVVAPVGLLNGAARGGRYGINVTTANATLGAVVQNWAEWTQAWGWDDALLALSMTRLGWTPDAIVAQLLDPKFPFYRSGQTLCCPTYLPGNGGLLLAVAVMASGTDSSPPLLFPASWGAVAEGFDVRLP